MNDLMIDLETLGTDPSAPVIEIGAAFFDPETGEYDPSTFRATVKFESACERRTPDASTIQWWLGQSDAARKKVVSGTATMEDALSDFCKWVRAKRAMKDIKPWGNGATFDITMLEDCMKQYGIAIPWGFWNIRDVRTVLDVTGFDKSTVAFDGTAHSTLDDALHQIKYMSAAYQTVPRYVVGDVVYSWHQLQCAGWSIEQIKEAAGKC